MIRFICRETDDGAASNVGGPVFVRHSTLTDATALEAWLTYSDVNEHGRKWITRELLGCEVVSSPAGAGQQEKS